MTAAPTPRRTRTTLPRAALGALGLLLAAAAPSCSDDDPASTPAGGAGGGAPSAGAGPAGTGGAAGAVATPAGAGGGGAGAAGGPLACTNDPLLADPLPETALGEPVGEAGYAVRAIRGGLYEITDGLYQSLFLVTAAGVVAIDAPPSLGPNLLKAIAETTSQPVTHLVYTHAHRDHIGAAGLFDPGVARVAHEETARLLERAQDPARPPPTQTFATSLALDVGGQTLQLDYRGNNHEPGNIFVYAPAQKTLMLVDVVFPGWVPFQYLAVTTDVPGFIAAHDQALAYDFETFVGGHLTRLGTRADVETQRQYVADLRANAAEALGSVSFAAIAAASPPGNAWKLFDNYLGAVVDRCAERTLAAWRGKLGGADVFTRHHCHTMQTSLRLD
ncbi:MAG TPA: MBL fold metallo-hydrolase [Polyangiaceae bacterium]|nr:MBL fold metallo-hydrolase [Polyangiaceae bacterium]